MKILTATEIKQREKDYFDNPNQNLKKYYNSLHGLQRTVFIPLIKRVKELIN